MPPRTQSIDAVVKNIECDSFQFILFRPTILLRDDSYMLNQNGGVLGMCSGEAQSIQN